MGVSRPSRHPGRSERGRDRRRSRRRGPPHSGADRRADADGVRIAGIHIDDTEARRIAALSEPRLHLVRRPWDDKAGRLSAQITVDEAGAVSGIELPAGLVDGSPLPEPIFTPSTKAPVGEHDEPISIDICAASNIYLDDNEIYYD